MEIARTAPVAHNMRSPELATELTTVEPSLASVASACLIAEDRTHFFIDGDTALL